MVEELARWKSALSIRINDLQENIKNLLEERSKVHNSSLNACYNLMELNEKYSATSENLPSLRTSNILELSEINNMLSANIAAKLFNDKTTNNNNNNEFHTKISKLPNLTKSESIAKKVNVKEEFPYTRNLL